MGMGIKLKNQMLRIGFIVDVILLVQPTASPVRTCNVEEVHETLGGVLLLNHGAWVDVHNIII